MQEMWVRSLGQEDPLEEGMATHSSILAWGIPWTEEPGRLQSMGSQRVGHNWATNTQRPHTLNYMWSLSSLKATSENLFHVDFLLHFRSFWLLFLCLTSEVTFKELMRLDQAHLNDIFIWWSTDFGTNLENPFLSITSVSVTCIHGYSWNG